jgi:hypothetical protein
MDTPTIPTSLRLVTDQDLKNMDALNNAEKVIFHGSNTTAEKSDTGWVSTKWEAGIPVARMPVTNQLLAKFMSDRHHSII